MSSGFDRSKCSTRLVKGLLNCFIKPERLKIKKNSDMKKPSELRRNIVWFKWMNTLMIRYHGLYKQIMAEFFEWENIIIIGFSMVTRKLIFILTTFWPLYSSAFNTRVYSFSTLPDRSIESTAVRQFDML